MRRAEKRGKELPKLLKAALEAQADGKLLVTDGVDFKSAGFIGLAPAEAYSIGYEKEKSATLRSGLVSDVIQAEILDMTHANDVIRECGDTCPTLQARMGTGGNQIPLVIKSECLTLWDYQSRRIYAESGSYPCLQAKENSGIDQTAVLTVEPTYCIQGNTIDRSDTAGANGKGVLEGESYTLSTVDRHAVCHPIGFCPNNSESAAGLSEASEGTPTLSTTKKIGVCYPINTQIVTRWNKEGKGTGFGLGEDREPAYTLQEAHSHGVIYAIDRAAFNQGENAKYDFQIDDSGVNSTLVARGPSAVCYNISGKEIAGTLDAHYYLGCGARGGKEREVVSVPQQYHGNLFVWVVRRLTPRECERLQGFKDDWTKYDMNGNELKDTPRYKTLGNSIAVPCALRIFRGIVEAETAGL